MRSEVYVHHSVNCCRNWVKFFFFTKTMSCTACCKNEFSVENSAKIRRTLLSLILWHRRTDGWMWSGRGAFSFYCVMNAQNFSGPCARATSRRTHYVPFFDDTTFQGKIQWTCGSVCLNEIFLVQQMHYLLKHKILQFVFKCLNVHFSDPTCFGPLGPSSASIHRNLAKVTKIAVF
jgi:hypothetical protein